MQLISSGKERKSEFPQTRAAHRLLLHSSIGELVEHRKNGFVFDGKEQLFEYLSYWFARFPSNASLDHIKREFQDNLASFQNLRWTENWNKDALPLFT